MQQHDGWAVRRACFGVPDAQDVGVDLLERAERRTRPWIHVDISVSLVSSAVPVGYRCASATARAAVRMWSVTACG